MTTPRDLDRDRVRALQQRVSRIRAIGVRMAALSETLLGKPYITDPLIGSAQLPEVFTISMEAFCCVTYIETVLALALSRDPNEFIEFIRRIRYQNGLISWDHRNHYMTGWIRSNERGGLIENLTNDMSPISRQRVLSVLDGLPPKSVNVRCVPKRTLLRSSGYFHDGDLIFFGSTRSNLDIFHCGVLVRSGDRLLLRHAARSRGSVVEQQLEEFLTKNRMSGCIVVRPLDEPEGNEVAHHRT